MEMEGDGWVVGERGCKGGKEQRGVRRKAQRDVRRKERATTRGWPARLQRSGRAWPWSDDGERNPPKRLAGPVLHPAPLSLSRCWMGM